MPWFNLADGLTQAQRSEARTQLRDALSTRQTPDADVTVAISTAFPEADLDAAVWPGVSTIAYLGIESAEEVEAAAELITSLEKRRGLRPRSVALDLRIATPSGVQRAFEIASSNERVARVGIGDSRALAVSLGAATLMSDALVYARGECELAARSAEVVSNSQTPDSYLDDFEPTPSTTAPMLSQ